MKDRKTYTLLYVIDVSGQPYENTRIGMGSFLLDKQTSLLKEFYKQFPDFKRSRNKGSALKNTHHFEKIINFLDMKGVHMTLFQITGKQWKKYRDIYVNKAYLKEKIMACSYFMLLKKKTNPNYMHQIIIDKDSFMDLDKLVDYIQKLAKAKKYKFSITIGRAKDNDLIRLTDYIAASHKINKQQIGTLKNYTFMTEEIPKEYLQKLLN